MLSCTCLLQLQIPLAIVLVPMCAQNFRVELDFLVQVPLPGCALDIGLDLGRWSVKVRPVWVGLKRECVCMSWYVASSSGISVLGETLLADRLNS